eukprot:892043-Pyramimonas_sp.AAC.2
MEEGRGPTDRTRGVARLAGPRGCTRRAVRLGEGRVETLEIENRFKISTPFSELRPAEATRDPEANYRCLKEPG